MIVDRDALFVWYLAMLRKNTRSNSAELTPRTLVETDKQMIQEIVASGHATEAQERERVLAQIRSKNNGARILNCLLFAASVTDRRHSSVLF